MKAAQKRMVFEMRGPEVAGCYDGQEHAEDGDAAAVAETFAVGGPVAECGAQGLREHDGDPVEELDLGGIDSIDGDRSGRPIPDAERGEQQTRSTEDPPA